MSVTLDVEPLLAVLREAYAAGFSAPFLLEGENLIQDERFWHPGDLQSRRAKTQTRPVSVDRQPNPEER